MTFAIDLHTHTCYSDGALAPADLLRRARERGVTHLAITDHDSVGAWQSLDSGRIPAPLQLIPGVEISTRWQWQSMVKEIHIVALFINPSDTGLGTLLKQQQQLRRERAAGINRQLEKAGIHGLTSYLDALPCEAVSRNHIADFLIGQGLAANKQQAFKRHLGKGGRFAEAPRWCTMEAAVSCIHQAGGIAVLAHPDRYRLNRKRLAGLMEDFSEAGGEALEVSYSNLNPDTMKQLAALAEHFDFWASAGSDFHTPAAQWMDIGRIRHLPGYCQQRAVWRHPLWPDKTGINDA